PVPLARRRADSAVLFSGGGEYTTPERTSLNLPGTLPRQESSLCGNRDVAPGRLRRRERVLGAQHQQLGGLFAVPARHAGSSGPSVWLSFTGTVGHIHT